MGNIYINAQEEHNKFWAYEESGSSVKVKWGRLGLKGQEQTKDFASVFDRDDFIANKVSEKLRSGYKEVTPEEFEIKASIAASIGVGHKIDRMEFVRDGETLTVLSHKELHKPDTKPLVYAKLYGRRKTKEDKPPVVELLIDVDKAYVIETNYRFGVLNRQPIQPGHDYENLVGAVGQCIGRVLL